MSLEADVRLTLGRLRLEAERLPDPLFDDLLADDLLPDDLPAWMIVVPPPVLQVSACFWMSARMSVSWPAIATSRFSMSAS